MGRVDNHKIILTIVVGFLVLFWLTGINGFIYATTIIGLLTLFSSKIAGFIVWIWLKLSQGLGWINSRILLTLIFIVFLLPFALIQRLFFKNAIKQTENTNSLFSDRDHLYVKSDLEKQW